MLIEYKIQRMVNADAYEIFAIDRANKTISCVEVPCDALYHGDYEHGMSQAKLESIFRFYGGLSTRSCSLGCDLVDTGSKWSFCRNCEQQYEFKNWEWQMMRKAK